MKKYNLIFQIKFCLVTFQKLKKPTPFISPPISNTPMGSCWKEAEVVGMWKIYCCSLPWHM